MAAEAPSTTATTSPARPSALPLLVGAGLFAGLGQVILLRQLLNVAAGNELTIGLMLAIWLLFAAAGTALFGRVAQRSDEHRLVRTIAKASVLAPLSLILGITLARVSLHLLDLLPLGIGTQWGEMMGLGQLAAVSVAVVAPTAMLAGALFAGGLRLNALNGEGALPVGQAYAADAIGHLAGGVLGAVLVLAGVHPPFQGIAAGAAPIAGAAWACARRPESIREARFRLALLLAVYVGACICVASLLQRDSLSIRWAGRGLITQTDTIYGNLAVTRFGDDGVYFYRDGVPESCSPPTPGIQYLVHFPLLQTPRPERVLLVGGGATGGLREVLKHGPATVDYVELDPALIRLARQYVVGADRAALDDPRVHIHNLDGRLFVKRAGRASEQYDAVILSLPEPGTAQINRFYTREFLGEVRAILKPETGVLGLQIPSSETYLGEELRRLNAVLYRTLREVFPRTALLPGGQMIIAAAPNLPLTEDANVLRARLDERRIEAADFRAHVWDRLFPFTVAQVRGGLDEAPDLPVNTDTHPIGYFYGQAYWVAQHSRSSWVLFNALSRLRLWHVLAATGASAAVLLVLAGLAPRTRRGAVPLSVLGTGALAMALEVTLLLGFQVYYGFVFLEVGIITGAFMVGLAMGGWWTARHAEDLEADECRRLLAIVQVALAIVAACLPGLMALVGTASGGWAATVLPHVGFPLLATVVGLGVGAGFPLASKASGTQQLSRSAAVLYALDLVGAALGALVAGTALLPVLGLTGTCVAAAALGVALAALLAVPERDQPSCCALPDGS